MRHTSYGMATRKSKKRKTKDKNRRDKHACLGPLHIGDRVLVRNCVERRGTGKLPFYWENDIYKIVDCKGEDSLVYRCGSCY